MIVGFRLTQLDDEMHVTANVEKDPLDDKVSSDFVHNFVSIIIYDIICLTFCTTTDTCMRMVV